MNPIKSFAVAAAVALLTLTLATPSMAHGGGGGGGGSKTGGSLESGIPLAFQSVSINGTAPSWSGSYDLLHSIAGYYVYDILHLQVKGKSINLPDGTLLYSTVYSTDSLTGLPFAPTTTSFPVSKKAATENVQLSLFVPSFTTVYRVINGVEIRTADGTLLAQGR